MFEGLMAVQQHRGGWSSPLRFYCRHLAKTASLGPSFSRINRGAMVIVHLLFELVIEIEERSVASGLGCTWASVRDSLERCPGGRRHASNQRNVITNVLSISFMTISSSSYE